MKKQFSFKKMMKAHPEYWYVLFLPGYLLCFFLVEAIVPADCDYWVSYCRLDDYIPFLEGFIVPYCCWYPLLFCVGVYLMVFDVPEFKRYMWFLILGCGLSLLFCVIFPNGQDLRPASFDHDNLYTRLIAGIYAADTNTNVLPSMHVVGCFAAAVAACRSGMLRRYRPLVIVVAVAISLSTVFVKQHSVLDIFAGIALALPIWWGLYLRRDCKARRQRKP